MFGKKQETQISDTESPYLAARREWLERYGDYIKRASQWRMVAFISLGLAAIAVCGNVIQSSQSKIVPYIVEVDKLGKAVAVARADDAGTVPNRIIQAEIASLITNWRSVTADNDLQKRMLTRLSSFIGGSASGTMRTWYAENNPYERARQTLVSVDIKGLPLPVSQNSWRIEWTETTRSHVGAVMKRESFEATVSVQITAPTTDAQIIRNPAGVLITSLTWSNVLGQQEKNK